MRSAARPHTPDLQLQTCGPGEMSHESGLITVGPGCIKLHDAQLLFGMSRSGVLIRHRGLHLFTSGTIVE